MKAFVTGGTGFIGSRLVKRLVERGYTVNVLVRSQEGAAFLRTLGANPVWGDITAMESMREGMQGCDRVFHLAGWYKLGNTDRRKFESINVDGTRNVLGMAFQLGIPRIVYTSSVAVYGDTHGHVPDETYHPPAGPFLTEYDRTKWMAHYEVALPLIQKGAPVIIVMPGAVYGPGDPSLVGDFMCAFYRGLFPVLPGPELTLTYAYVDDVVDGILLVAEKGLPGETYHLAGDIANLGQITRLWAAVSGRPAPYFAIPGSWLTPFVPLMGWLNSIVSLPVILSRDAVAILEATYLAQSEKARRQLGWRTRPLEDGMRETFLFIAQESAQSAQKAPTPGQRRQIASIAIGAALGLFAVWLLTRQRR